MPKKLQKRLRDYLTKIKKPPPALIPISSKKWMRACKHPKTLSFAINNNNTHETTTRDKDDDAATLSDIDEFLFENFRSLYLTDDQEADTTDDYETREENTLEMKQGHEKESANEPFWNKPLHMKKRRPDHHHHETLNQDHGFMFESPRLNFDPPASSHRFSVSPGRLSSSVRTTTTTTTTSEDAGSTSITSARTVNVDSPTTSSHCNNNDHHVSLPTDCISVLMYSPNPSYEFKRSMHDMVEARLRNNAKVDWNFMEELLFCYLNLNEKKSHRFILSAFADLVVDMRQDHGEFEISGELKDHGFQGRT